MRSADVLSGRVYMNPSSRAVVMVDRKGEHNAVYKKAIHCAMFTWG